MVKSLFRCRRRRFFLQTAAFFLICVIWELQTHPAQASDVKICNTGDIPLSMVSAWSTGMLALGDKTEGWYVIDPGDCQVQNASAYGIVSLGFAVWDGADMHQVKFEINSWASRPWSAPDHACVKDGLAGRSGFSYGSSQGSASSCGSGTHPIAFSLTIQGGSGNDRLTINLGLGQSDMDEITGVAADKRQEDKRAEARAEAEKAARRTSQAAVIEELEAKCGPIGGLVPFYNGITGTGDDPPGPSLQGLYCTKGKALWNRNGPDMQLWLTVHTFGGWRALRGELACPGYRNLAYAMKAQDWLETFAEASDARCGDLADQGDDLLSRIKRHLNGTDIKYQECVSEQSEIKVCQTEVGTVITRMKDFFDIKGP